ncbi:MAG: twin-arginine translocase TatA/TatE family subunit [Alphaproteobacteria bacterium]|jgi:sec-independent protein translocase protein TatA
MGIGFWQLVVVLLIVLLLFGRGKLPALAEDLGKSIRSFKKGMEENEVSEKDAAEKDSGEEKKD